MVAAYAIRLIALAGAVLWTIPTSDDAPSGKHGRDHQWAQWRGPFGTGAAPHANPPIVWSEDAGVRWKTDLPGLGHSAPVVWGDRIFVTAAVPFGESLPSSRRHARGAHDNVDAERALRFVVLAINREDGSVAWEQTVHQGRPHDSTHETGSWASASPVTDGECIVATFGSQGIYGLDWNGTVRWRRDLGEMRSKHGHGEGSSPALHGDTLVVNWDHEGASFVTGMDKRTGVERWRTEREEGTSWSSPLIVDVDGSPHAIISATHRVRAYDLIDGRVVWECGGLSGNVVATPVAADGIVYVANSYETREMLAIRLAGAKGDITGTDAVLWTRHRDTPYVPSPLLYAGQLCFLKHYQGVMTCVDAETGATRWGPERLPGIGNVYASPVGAAGRIYLTDRDGTTVVLQHGPALQVLAVNHLDDSFSASPALVGRELFLRGERYLYCLAEPQ